MNASIADAVRRKELGPLVMTPAMGEAIAHIRDKYPQAFGQQADPDEVERLATESLLLLAEAVSEAYVGESDAWKSGVMARAAMAVVRGEVL